MRVEDRTGRQPCIAVIAAVCKCHGVWAWDKREYSYNAQAYVAFLEQCKARWDEEHPNQPMVVFLDNCRVHTSIYARKWYPKLDIEVIWNLAYSPEYNLGIERYWGQLKAAFRPLLLQYMLKYKKKDKPLERAVTEVIEQASPDSIPAYIEAAKRYLREDAARLRYKIREEEELFK